MSTTDYAWINAWNARVTLTREAMASLAEHGWIRQRDTVLWVVTDKGLGAGLR
jgi:hypothetical protein